MSQRQLHIAAYDIRDSRRLRRTLHILKDFASGGQKSVFECYLSAAEKKELLNRVDMEIDKDDDRFLVVPVRSESVVKVMGIAVMPTDEQFFYVG